MSLRMFVPLSLVPHEPKHLCPCTSRDRCDRGSPLTLSQLRTAFLPLLSLCGCIHHLRIPASEVAELPGVYQNNDGFWPRWLELKEDGTFNYTQLTDVLKQSADGSMVFEGGWRL